MGELLRGVVKWFNDAKGFGFIEHESGRDVFVHYSVIEQDGFKTLKDGEEVVYELKEGDKGLHAQKVVRANATENAVETKHDEASAADAARSLVAPNLETGNVKTETREASASSIEVEKEKEDELTGAQSTIANHQIPEAEHSAK